MHFGAAMFFTDYAMTPAELGRALEERGFESVWAPEHSHIPLSRKSPFPQGGELPIWDSISGKVGNSLVLAAQVKAMGGEPRRYPITKDNFDLICERVQEAARDHDLILLNAGSSAGAEDFSAKVVETLGTLLVHGVAVRPGHPVILGLINRQSSIVNRKSEPVTRHSSFVPIIGVPGYPVSAALTIDIFVEPLLSRWLGRRPRELPTETATLTRKIVSPAGDDDFVRVAVGKVGDKLLAAPLSRGAGVITSLVQADGLALIPRG